jgi:DNA-binding CsgD family transcriptional regulator
MHHYVFAWQIAALLMGVALLPLLAARMKAKPGAFPAAFLVSDLAMLARTAVFSTVHYDQSTQLGIFPAHFEDSATAGLVFLAFVVAADWTAVAGLFRTTRRRGLPAFSLPYWAYVGLILAVYILVVAELRIPEPLRGLANFRYMAVVSFTVIKGLAASALLYLFFRSLTGAAERPVAIAAALLVLSMGADAWLRLDETAYAFSVPLLYLSYYGAFFILALSGSGRAGDPEGRGKAAPGLAEAWSRDAGLEAGEALLLGLLLEGKGNKEIAFSLGLGLSAEKHRVQKLFRKLGVGTRSELLARAAERALLARP